MSDHAAARLQWVDAARVLAIIAACLGSYALLVRLLFAVPAGLRGRIQHIGGPVDARRPRP